MSSTFGSLNTAYSGLVAARRAIDVAGQNIANVNTEGYTRQRVEQSSINGAQKAGLGIVRSPQPGAGVEVTGITRMGDTFLESQVRKTASQSSYAETRATALVNLESGINEPSDNGISATLQRFWTSWGDLANNPGAAAPSFAVIENASMLRSQLASGYDRVEAQWNGEYAKLPLAVEELNNLSEELATINGFIQEASRSGASINELIDKRNLAASKISALAGGTFQEESDGTLTVSIGGGVLVDGTEAKLVALGGGSTMDGTAPQLEWASRPGSIVSLEGGELAANISLLAPSNASGTGGILAETAKTYSTIATEVATQVNAIHSNAYTTSGVTGLDFFSLTAGVPAAKGLNVIPTDGTTIASGGAGLGPLDGSAADQISLISKQAGSPDSIWGSLVAKIASSTRSEVQQSNLADLTFNVAVSNLQSASSVDMDEESLNLMTAQTAYQAAARALTAVDEMLDTLINRMGLVGR